MLCLPLRRQPVDLGWRSRSRHRRDCQEADQSSRRCSTGRPSPRAQARLRWHDARSGSMLATGAREQPYRLAWRSACRRRRSSSGRRTTVSCSEMSPNNMARHAVTDLRAVLAPQHHAFVDGGQKSWTVVARLVDLLGERDIRIATEAVDHLCRCFADDGTIERGGEPVDVGPRPLGGGIVLVRFGRGVPRRDERRGCPRLLAERLPGGAEVEENRGSVALLDIDVGGLDIAMDDIRLMHDLQRVYEGPDDGIELLLRRPASSCGQPGLEILTDDESEHHVGGAVLLEVARDADDVGMPETGQRPRLGEKSLQTPIVTVQVGIRARIDGRAGVAIRKRCGKVLLDGDLNAEAFVSCQVGYSEPAGAEHALYLVITTDHGTFGQCLPMNHTSAFLPQPVSPTAPFALTNLPVAVMRENSGRHTNTGQSQIQRRFVAMLCVAARMARALLSLLDRGGGNLRKSGSLPRLSAEFHDAITRAAHRFL